MTRAGIERRDRLLAVHLGTPHRVLSWAVARGGLVEADTVAWLQVTDDELRPPVEPERLLAERLAAASLARAVGLMTSAALEAYRDVVRAADGIEVRCVATVGLDNALRAGDPTTAVPVQRAGTINVLCVLPFPVEDQTLVEALALAAEARTVAVLDGGILSRASGLPATGTGTDCLVVAAPSGVPRARWAGKHTALGHLVGAAVADAVGAGVHAWLARRRRAAEATTPAGGER